MKGLTLVLVGAMLSIAMLPAPAMAGGTCASPQANVPSGLSWRLDYLPPGESDWYFAPFAGDVIIRALDGSVGQNVWGPCGIQQSNRCNHLGGPGNVSRVCEVRAGERLEIYYRSAYLAGVDYLIKYE